MFFDAIIFPLEVMMQWILLELEHILGSWGLSIIALSAVVSLVMIPFQRIAAFFRRREESLQSAMKSELDMIRECYTGIKRNEFIWNVYRRYHYHPILALRASFGLLILIPFFYAAYDLLSSFQGYQGVPFLFSKDLSQPDATLGGINVMPIFMAVASLFYLWISRRFGTITGGWKVLTAVTVAFVVILYRAPTALVLYWTMNNVFGVIGVLALACWKAYSKTPIPHTLDNFLEPATPGWMSAYPLHALILGPLAVLCVYYNNAQSGAFPLYVVVKPLFHATLAVAVAFAICLLLCRNVRRAGLLVTFPGVILLFGGGWASSLGVIMGDGRLFSVRLQFYIAGVLYTVMGGLFLLLLWKLRNRVAIRLWTGRLNVVCVLFSVLLVSATASRLSRSSAAGVQFEDEQQQWIPRPKLTQKQRSELPNIVFVLADGMPANSVVEQWLGDSLSSFEGELQSMGFKIVDDTYTTYPATIAQVCALLNANTLQMLLPDLEERSNNRGRIKKRIQVNAVLSHLHHYGYETYTRSADNYISTIGSTHRLRSYDGAKHEFYTGVINQSLLYLPRLLFVANARFSIFGSDMELFREDLIEGLSDIQEVPASHMSSNDKPSFSFIHLTYSHAPYVFRRDGTPRGGNAGYTLNADAQEGGIKGRIMEQTHFLNSAFLENMRRLLDAQKNSSRPLIVMIMGDHAPHELPGITNQWDRLGMAAYPPFAAIYSSDNRLGSISSISFPNVFRWVLNKYWHLDMPILPDRSYLIKANNPYDCRGFIDVTDEVDAINNRNP